MTQNGGEVATGSVVVKGALCPSPVFHTGLAEQIVIIPNHLHSPINLRKINAIPLFHYLSINLFFDRQNSSIFSPQLH